MENGSFLFDILGISPAENLAREKVGVSVGQFLLFKIVVQTRADLTQPMFEKPIPPGQAFDAVRALARRLTLGPAIETTKGMKALLGPNVIEGEVVIK